MKKDLHKIATLLMVEAGEYPTYSSNQKQKQKTFFLPKKHEKNLGKRNQTGKKKCSFIRSYLGWGLWLSDRAIA